MITEIEFQYKLTDFLFSSNWNFFFQFQWIFKKTSGDQQGVWIVMMWDLNEYSLQLKLTKVISNASWNEPCYILMGFLTLALVSPTSLLWIWAKTWGGKTISSLRLLFFFFFTVSRQYNENSDLLLTFNLSSWECRAVIGWNFHSRAGNPGNVLLTSRNQKYFYQWSYNWTTVQ